MQNSSSRFLGFKSFHDSIDASKLQLPARGVPPKIIWFFWAQGLDSAPDVVLLSIKSWSLLNPEFEVRVLDEGNVSNYFPYWNLLDNSPLSLGYAHKADYLRLYLLNNYGGFWVDATVFCWQPISIWSETHIYNNGYFFPRQTVIKDRCIKNWLIASIPSHPILLLLERCLLNYIFNPRRSLLKMKHLHGYKSLIRGRRYLEIGCRFLDQCESIGFYPYYYFHYLYNEVVRNLKLDNSPLYGAHERMISLRDLTPGTKKNKIDGGVCFSKQSYRAHHLNSPEYNLRKLHLLSFLDS